MHNKVLVVHSDNLRLCDIRWALASEVTNGCFYKMCQTWDCDKVKGISKYTVVWYLTFGQKFNQILVYLKQFLANFH